MQLRQHCGTSTRRQRVAETPGPLNGIDFVEVLDQDAPSEELRQRIVRVRFLKPDGVAALGAENFWIEGGIRVRGLRVKLADPPRPDDRTVDLELDRAGDFSTYTLYLRANASSDEPPADMDPVLSCVEFSFKADCATDFDCREPEPFRAAPPPGPVLDYLAKDYESFRRLMLDRMAVTAPAWSERSPADLGVTLVEALAFAGDHASYYQDAVATEAYLPLARRRSSARRHARLLGERLDEGCNARAFVAIDAIGSTEAAPDEEPLLPLGARILSMPQGLTLRVDSALKDDQVDLFARFVDAGATVFETMEDVRSLREKRNAMRFHAWGERDCHLPAGATQAHLVGTQAELGLSPGDVLILEERVPVGGTLDDPPDASHRQAVRLVGEPREVTDPLGGVHVVEIHWHPEDALRFALNLASHPGDEPGAVARGNVVLADHGLTRTYGGKSPRQEDGKELEDDSALLPPAPTEGHYRPALAAGPVTFARPYDRDAERGRPAASLLRGDPREAEPGIELAAEGETWRSRRDLLASGPFDPCFAVETESDGSASLRFGDGRFGRRPGSSAFRVRLRIGSGPEGNVSAGALRHVFTRQADAIEAVCNPLPAEGGSEPETLTHAKIHAPRASRRQRRAVTAADYARVAEEHPRVQRAVANRRWTGSWYTVFVSVDPVGRHDLGEALERSLRDRIEIRRLAGHDVEIERPLYVPLDLALVVCVEPDHYASDVEQRLLRIFGSGVLPDGTPGFFHPDRFSFGTPVHLSRIIARAMQVAGVRWIGTELAGFPEAGFLRRLRDQSVDYAPDGVLTVDRREVVRLDNDPNAPENGRLRFFVEGGR
jgi:hypothetical protein